LAIILSLDPGTASWQRRSLFGLAVIVLSMAGPAASEGLRADGGGQALTSPERSPII
jgi:hypothetical protein